MNNQVLPILKVHGTSKVLLTGERTLSVREEMKSFKSEMMYTRRPRIYIKFEASIPVFFLEILMEELQNHLPNWRLVEQRHESTRFRMRSSYVKAEEGAVFADETQFVFRLKEAKNLSPLEREHTIAKVLEVIDSFS